MTAVTEIKARLARPGTPFSYVKGAMALSQVKDKPPGVAPMAFVMAAKEVSAENQRMSGSVLQRQERDIIVLIIAEALGDADGDTADDALEEIKVWVRSSLIGFLPTDMQVAGEPITHVSGEVIQAGGGMVWFEDTYSAPTYIKEAS